MARLIWSFGTLKKKRPNTIIDLSSGLYPPSNVVLPQPGVPYKRTHLLLSFAKLSSIAPKTL